MDVRLLGPLEVRLEDGPVELGPRKQRAVLAMLALEPGRTVSADRLTAGLWGEDPPASAPKMVQLYVSHLRRALEGDGARIVTHGRGYALELTDGEVDAVRFERLLDESRPREALALWSGDPLADLADEPFAATEIRRLDGLRLRAAESAIDADLAGGRHAEVIGELEALVAAEPLRERLHAQLMLALYRSGRQADALAAYRAARAELVEQIGVEPGAELQQLHDAILAHDRALDLPAAAGEAPAARPQRPSPRRLLVGAAVVLVAGVTAFGLIRLLGPESLPGIDEDAVGLIDPDGGRITAQYSVGHSPGAITAGGGSVWVANTADGTVSRIDRDRQIVTIDVGGAPIALAFGAGSLWVADGESRFVAQVDPGSNKVLQRIEAANAPRSLALAEGALWVVSGAEGDVHRLDLGSARPARAVPVGMKATAIAAGAGALWVAGEEADSVVRLDPRTGAVVAGINVGHAPGALAVGEGAVWVVNRTDGTLSRVDPAENAVSGTVRVGTDPTAVAVGEGAVWVAGGEDGTVARIDPDGPRVVERLKTGSSPSALAVADGSVWTAAVAPEAAHRGGTLRVDVPISGPFEANWLHDDGYFFYTWMLVGLTSDGLVAYRRVPGVAGATLVGGLATRPPAPSADGRTYVFTLRRGIRYSDGTPVEPGDFRASMERYLGARADRFPTFFAGIVGARRCMRERGPCDLSRGIESDAKARTITVHLTAPDSAFLHRLTLPFAYLVPPGTPARTADAGFVAPGTGPYRITAWDPERGGTLVRNPQFRPTAARPAGFVDRIEVRPRPVGRVETHTAPIERGSSDLVWLTDLPLLRGKLPDVVARAPGRLHSSPTTGTWWMFLNVQRPPFDDIRVRRAVNLAVDRAELVEAFGGPEAAAPVCQILPPAFPGFSPHCPYTADPSRGGGWTAPDLERARRLVAASGRAGASVTVDVSVDDRRRVGPYFVSLLRDLGFRPRMRVHSAIDYYDAIMRPGSRKQMGVFGWFADYMSPGSMLDPTFACTARGDPAIENVAHVCDAKLDAAINRARAAPARDAVAAWAVVDRRVVDLAAAVPYVSSRVTVLASKRVGNVTHHPMYLTQLDQVWVR